MDAKRLIKFQTEMKKLCVKHMKNSGQNLKEDLNDMLFVMHITSTEFIQILIKETTKK